MTKRLTVSDVEHEEQGSIEEDDQGIIENQLHEDRGVREIFETLQK